MKNVICEASPTEIVRGLKRIGCWLILPLEWVCFCPEIASAQIIPDGSLNTTVIPNGDRFIILKGTPAGNNLFHSFQQFSVSTGGAATFDLIDTPNISTIFSRVTGGSLSRIDGLIETSNHTQPVSLFLLNPSGILFGSNAQLNLGGSFVGTTAERIQFAEGGIFRADTSPLSSLLTINVPIGLQFGSNSGAIAVRDNVVPPPIPGRLDVLDGLQVSPGNTLALLGNGITLVSGNLNSVNGSIELASIGSGEVYLTSTLQGFSFDYSQVAAFSDIQLTQQSQIIGAGIGQTTLNLQGRNIQLSEGSTLIVANRGPLEGDRITVNATELLSLSRTNFSRTNGSRIVTNTSGEGKGGDVTISARQAIVEDGGQIATQADGSGIGGDMNIRVSESIFVDGIPSLQLSTVTGIVTVSSATGQSGSLTLSAQQLQVNNSGTIGSTVYGSGDGGNVQINVSDSIEVSGVNSRSLLPSSLSTSTIGWGNAGDLNITTAKLAVREGALVSSSTGGVASAGNLTIQASHWIEVSGAAPGSILSSGLGSNALSLDPVSRAVYQLPDIPTGNAGGVSLNTPQLRVLDRAEVGVRNDGTGNAGNFEVNADTIILNNRGAITAETQSGNGGNLLLNVRERLQMRDNSKISVEAGGTGDGGNITIESPVILGWENSDITANAIQGRGGNIQVTAQGILGLQFRDRLTPGNDITASSQFGFNGTVRINTLDVEPSSGLVQLPANPVDPTQQIVVGCADTQNNRFVATGRGGVPENPTQRVILDRAWLDIRTLSSDRAPLPAQSLSTPESLREAVGWYRNPQGSIELVPSTSLVRGSSLPCLRDSVPKTSSNLQAIPSQRSPVF